MNIHVTEVQTMSDYVKRISTTEHYSMDIHSTLFDCKEGDILQIQYAFNPLPSPTYMTCGTVYHSTPTGSCISSGGLLSHLPTSIPMHSKVYINLSKTRKTKRPNGQPNTRKKHNSIQ